MENNPMNILGKFRLNRQQMQPAFDHVSNIKILDTDNVFMLKDRVFEERRHWVEILQKGNYKLTADKERYHLLYETLIEQLEMHLGEKVIAKTCLDFFLFDVFDDRWESEPSGFIHNDWGNFSTCLSEFADKAQAHCYQPHEAIALVLPIALPACGSGLELYDVFHAEGVSGKVLLNMREKERFRVIPYTLGEATLFCPYQFHSGACAKPNTLKATDTRIVLVAFLIRYTEGAHSAWHMFRMCKGATLEYKDKALYDLKEDTLNQQINEALKRRDED